MHKSVRGILDRVYLLFIFEQFIKSLKLFFYFSSILSQGTLFLVTDVPGFLQIGFDFLFLYKGISIEGVHILMLLFL